MLNSSVVSPNVRAAIIAQLAKGGYKLPSLQTFNLENFGKIDSVLQAGNM